MNKSRLIVIVAVIAVVILTTFGLKSSNSKPPSSIEVRREIGYIAPDFTIKDINGKEVKLSELRGKAVYINFWASWCPPCVEEIPSLMKFYERNKHKVVFLVIDWTYKDKIDDVRKLMQQYKINYPVMLDTDPDQGAFTAFDISAVPEHYFIDKDGVLRAEAIGVQTLQQLEANLKKAL